MKIVYASKTGNVRRFVQKLGVPASDVMSTDWMTEPFILITYTIGFGEVPSEVAEFLADNHEFLRGVIASGDKVWGANYGKSGDIISREYGVPLIHKFEKAGMESDVQTVKQYLDDAK